MSTRRTSEGLLFDHGAQYFTARDPRFQRYVESWMEQGLIAEWTGRITSVQGGQLEPDNRSGDETRRFVGLPAMNAICRHLGDGLRVQYGTLVGSAERVDNRWQLRNSKGQDLGAFDTLVVAMPAPQAAELLSGARALAETVRRVPMSGCWAVMLAFEEPIPVPYDGAFVRDSALSWVARNSSKPGQQSDVDCWVGHASPGWSERHLEDSPAEVLRQLLPAFFEATGTRPQAPIHSAAHRWRYALPPEPLSDRCLFDDDLAVGVCGDWCSGPRVEGAFLSGMSLAGRVMLMHGEPAATGSPTAG
jgi:predicted NAD/FAD-dependent oxidoreductase